MPALMKMGCEVPSSSSATSEFKTIEGFGICVSARVANGEKKIELVQQTAKRDKGPQM